MSKILKLILIFTFILSSMTGCINENSMIDEEIVRNINDLVILYVPSIDVGIIKEKSESLKPLLINSLASKGFNISNVSIEISINYEASGEALAAGSAHIGFLSGSTYVNYHDEGVNVLLTGLRPGLNKDSDVAADWNDGLPTYGDANNQVSYYRGLIYAGPSEYGRTLAAKVNAGEALTWDDVNGAQWCVSNSITSSSGYIYPSLWLLDRFGKKITDLEKVAPYDSYASIALGLATEQCDVGVGYADIRREHEIAWVNEWERDTDIWKETDVIGVTQGIYNDTISISTTNPDYSEELAVAIQEAFIEIAQTEEGKKVISIYNHIGYKVAVDSDYDGARAENALVQGS